MSTVSPSSGLQFTQTPTQLPSTSANSGNSTNAADLKTEFLQLMITQMQNQDPTQPVDDTQMVAEQAQMASLEQMQNMNTSMATLLAQQNVSQATSLIGKSVTGTDANGLSVTGTVTGISFANSVANLTVDTGSGSTSTITLPSITSVSQ
jgi:flagellar basal-body rod modification protein FlgD